LDSLIPDNFVYDKGWNGYVSMNMWGLTPDFMDIFEGGFVEFLSSLEPGDVKSEYLLPTIMDGLINSGKAKVKLLETNDMWVGLTHKEDKQIVLDAIKGVGC